MKVLQNVASGILVLMIAAALLLPSCAYYNTFYNARDNYRQAIKEKEKQKEKQDKISFALRKKFDKAIEKSNKTLRSYPDSKWSDDAQFIIAMSYYHKDDFKRAKVYYEQFLREYPNSPLVPKIKIWYGRTLWKLGETEQALHQLHNTFREVQGDQMKSEASLAIADIFQERQNPDSALHYLGMVTELSKKNIVAAEAQFKIAEIYLQKQQTEEAVKNLKRVSRFSPSPALKDQMQVLLARIYREARDFDAARTLIFDKLNEEENQKIAGQLELELGLVYMAEEDYESAVSRFTQITENYKRTPVSAKAYYHLAQLNMTQFGDYQKAEENFNLVNREDSQSPFGFEARQKSSEIKRFFRVQKSLEKSYEEAKSILDALVRQDSMAADVKPDSLLDSLGNELNEETVETRSSSPLDTLSIFEEYYRNLYEIAEIYYFNFEQRDSAITSFHRIIHSPEYNPYLDKTCYALYYIHTSEGDSLAARQYLTELEHEFPESPYLSYIKYNEIILPPREQEAEQLYQSAEPLFRSDPDSAVALLDQVWQKYPDTRYAEISAYAIGWLRENSLVEMQPAVDSYAAFLEAFPESEFAPIAQTSMQNLESVIAELEAAEGMAAAESTPSDSTAQAVPEVETAVSDTTEVQLPEAESEVSKDEEPIVEKDMPKPGKEEKETEKKADTPRREEESLPGKKRTIPRESKSREAPPLEIPDSTRNQPEIAP